MTDTPIDMTLTGTPINTMFSVGTAGSAAACQGSTTVMVSVSLNGSATVNGDVLLSMDAGVPAAFIGSGTVTIHSLKLNFGISGNGMFQCKIPIPGLSVGPPGAALAGLYLKLSGGFSGGFSLGPSISDLTLAASGGFINGKVLTPSASVTCQQAALTLTNFGNCFSFPVSASVAVSGTASLPWLQVGPNALNVGVGPQIAAAVGADTSAPGLYAEACGAAAWEADAMIPGFSFSAAGTLLGPYNIYSNPNTADTMGQCPLGPVAAPDMDLASGTNVVPGGSATATSITSTGQTVKATAQGVGTVSVGQYQSNPTGVPLFMSSGEYFDTSLSASNQFQQVQIEDCNLNGGQGISWWNPSLNSGGGGWQVVTTETSPSGSPPCIAVTINNSTTPNLTQLTGTVFGVSNLSEPTVTSIKPSQGSPSSFVLVTGTNLAPSTSDPNSPVFDSMWSSRFCFWACRPKVVVKFGATNAIVLFDNADKIGVLAPTGTGKVNVTVTVDGETSQISSADQFSYNQPPVPVVSSISPSSGGPFTVVNIQGSNLAPSSGSSNEGWSCMWWLCPSSVSVDFGTNAGFLLSDTADQVKVLAPRGQGTVDVTVTLNGVTTQTTPADQFTYVSRTCSWWGCTGN
jgi:hypothetical protein